MMSLDYSHISHHHEIGHHLVVADELSKALDHSPDLIGFVYQFAVGLLGGEVPVRGTHVFERHDLRFGIAARSARETARCNCGSS